MIHYYSVKNSYQNKESKMETSHTIEASNGCTIIRFLKAPGADQIRMAIDDVVVSYSTGIRLYIFSKGMLPLSSDDIESLALYGKSVPLPEGRVAFVCPDDLTFGLTRMFEVYRSGGKTEHMVFRTEQEAFDWLSAD
jgi:hypothetical protein